MGRVLVRVPPNWEHPKAPGEVWEGFSRKAELVPITEANGAV